MALIVERLEEGIKIVSYLSILDNPVHGTLSFSLAERGGVFYRECLGRCNTDPKSFVSS
jgi:hypothetical protein